MLSNLPVVMQLVKKGIARTWNLLTHYPAQLCRTKMLQRQVLPTWKSSSQMFMGSLGLTNNFPEWSKANIPISRCCCLRVCHMHSKLSSSSSPLHSSLRLFSNPLPLPSFPMTIWSLGVKARLVSTWHRFIVGGYFRSQTQHLPLP